MLIRVDKHLELLGAVRLACTLASPGAAVVVEVVPNLTMPKLDEGSIDAALDMHLDALILLPGRKCPGVLPLQVPALQQLRRMYPVMGGSYEKAHWEFCDRQRLFALNSRKGSRWDDIAGRYAPLSGVPGFAIREACRAAR